MIISKFKSLIIGTGVIATFFIIICCNKNGETNISSHGRHSHNMGKNCMDCHTKGGQGTGWFVIAGTVYDTIFPNNTPNPNGTVYLYTRPGGKGSLVATIEVDGKGNFYTTEKIDLSGGVYTKVVSAKGNIKYMSSVITYGACSSCHNFNTYKIYIN